MSGIGSNARERNKIFLAGFMGCGKSTIGPLVAEALGWDFVDTDRLIEQRARMLVPEIFQLLGEARFRTMEATVLSELLNGPPPGAGVVVALGGGTLLKLEARERLHASGGLVYLKTSVVELTARLASTASRRPLLTKGGVAGNLTELQLRVEELFREREPIYEEIGIHVPTDGRTPKEIARGIASWAKNGVLE